MSYCIEVVKDVEGVRIESASPLDYIPDGAFVIHGHQPVEGTYVVGSLGITLTSDGRHIGSSNGSYLTTIIKAAEPEASAQD